MLRHHLFKGLEIREDHIFRMHGEDDPNTEAVRYGRVMAENLPMQGKWPVFDFVLLGLGEDGHTASIFPGDADVLNSDKLCERTVHPQTGQVRITITLQVINHAKDVVFIVTGPEKAGIVADVILNPGKMAYPASHVNPLNGTLTWLLDPHASVRLH
jgi:6-phosphogluconolactonase